MLVPVCSTAHAQTGGAILASFVAVLNIAGTNFTQNDAQSADGGALAVTGNRQMLGAIQVESCHFRQNFARTVSVDIAKQPRDIAKSDPCRMRQL